MLCIEVPGGEFFDEEKEEFIQVKPHKLIMEHSLISLSKWESKWKKPFLADADKRTNEEYLDYIRCMTINTGIDPLVYQCLSRENLKQIREYIDDTQTATTIHSASPRIGRARTVTSELVYYWMIANNIPMACEKWHLNRLLMLIRICTIENNPKKKKMGRDAIYSQNRELNAARRAKYHTRG